VPDITWEMRGECPRHVIVEEIVEVDVLPGL